MTRETAAVLVMRAAAGDFGADVQAHLRRGLTLWRDSRGSSSLAACLGLPATPCRAATLARDAWLREAAARLPAGTAWQRSRGLADAVRSFLRRRWPAWSALHEPPLEGVAAVELALYYAAKAAPLPRSVRQLHRIVVE